MFGFTPDSQIILFGAINATTDPRKGFAHFQQALAQLGQTSLTGRAEVAVFGDTAPGSLGEAGMKTHYLGHFDDDQRLALLYSSADVMVTPSLQEAFGKTLIEAMACGTPVVAFNSGGPVDIIEHRADGYLARPFCAEDLAEGIAWCLAERARALELGQRGRAKVEREFDINVVANRYLALYQQILDAA
jgi:glycosyltransferase involved in cell wall biosynthesis